MAFLATALVAFALPLGCSSSGNGGTVPTDGDGGGATPGGGDGGVGGANLGPATTQGPSDAQLTPNNPFTCADGFPVQANPTFPQPFIGQGAQSCTLLVYNEVQPRAAGVIVSANLGIGPRTGPMRFVRMRILADTSAGTACCSAEQFGDVFTPRANAVTTIPLNFLMERGTDITGQTEAGTATGLIFNDWIGLEVLAPDVPLPGIWTRNGGSDIALPAYLWLPALSSRSTAPTLNLRSEGSFSAFQPTFNVSFAPVR